MSLSAQMPFSVVIGTVVVVLIVIFAGIKLVSIHPKAKIKNDL